ncbi:MAG: hypothetical protein U0457_19150 [Candidatus Sericytochromatia bacterium]
MKKLFLTTLISTITFLPIGVLANSENSPEFNPRASADFSENLNINDLAIAVDKNMNLKEVKIFDKKDGLYLVGPKDITEWEIKNKRNSLTWYKANSVYKYFSIKEFNTKAGKYKKYVTPYLLCLAKKYKVKLEIVTGRKTWPTFYIKDKQELEEQKKNLEELNTVLQEFPDLPNTFLSYDSNPAIWKTIAKDSEEYLNCLSTVKNPEKSKIVSFYVKEIEKTKSKTENFSGGKDGLYDSASYEWIFRALSDKARKEYIETQKGWNTDKEAVETMNKALDELKEVAKNKLPLLKMSSDLFKYRDSSSENVMKKYLKNASALKIHKIGFNSEGWTIVKNDLGIILYKYRTGQMWVKNNSDDHGFCKGLFFEIRQEYTGGGTFSNSFVRGYHEELYGCP